MSAEWRTVRLGDLTSFRKGVSYKGVFLDQPGPRLLGLGTILPGGGIRIREARTYGGPIKDSHRIGPGELLIALTDITQDGRLLGSPALVPLDADGEFAVTHHVARVELSQPELLESRYLYYLLKASEARDYFRGVATGTTVRAVSIADAEDFATDVPSIGEQRDIALLLGALDARIELNQRIAKTAHELARAIFRSRYRSDDPSLPHEPFFDHVDVARGLSYTGAGLADDGIPLHNLDSIYEGGGYKRDGIKRYSGDYKDRHLVHAGEVVVANTEQGFQGLLIACPARISSCFGDTGLFSHHLYRVRPSPDSPLSSPFLYLMLLPGRLRTEIAGYANGTTVNMLPVDALQKPRFAVPPRELVQEIDALVEPLFDRAEAAEDESETLAKLRDTLLPKLISGEVRLRDAELKQA